MAVVVSGAHSVVVLVMWTVTGLAGTACVMIEQNVSVSQAVDFMVVRGVEMLVETWTTVLGEGVLKHEAGVFVVVVVDEYSS